MGKSKTSTTQKKGEIKKATKSFAHKSSGGDKPKMSFAEGKKNISDFINSANAAFDSNMHCNIDNANLAKRMIQNLTDNLNNSFENNLALGQGCLKCRNVTDFIDIQRKLFEYNFKNTVKTCTDLVHDMQHITSHSMKNNSKCFNA